MTLNSATALDMKGLKILWAGMLVSIIAGIISGIVSGVAVQDATQESTSVAGTITGICSLISFILTLVGLSRSRKLSAYFIKARNLQIAAFVIGIIAVILLVVALGLGFAATAVSGSGTPDLTGNAAGVVICLVIFIVLLIITIVFSVLYNKNLLLGCRETAELCGDQRLAQQFRKTWKVFVAGAILLLIGSVLLSIGVIVQINSPGSSMVALLAVGGILLIIGIILFLVYTILVLVRISQLFRYHGKPLQG